MTNIRRCSECQAKFRADGNLHKVCSNCTYVAKIRAEYRNKKQRLCLMCLTRFTSSHIGNRICGSCKTTVDYKNSGEEYNVSAISKVPK